MGTYRGAQTIARPLESLARQTLPRDQFEVIVVQNGPPDDTVAVLDAVRAQYPDLTIRRAQCEAPGLGRARNIGMNMARGEYVTFVDDDDTISPNYLAGLLACSGPDTVGLGHMADVVDGGAPNYANRLSVQLSLAGRRLSPGDIILALTYSVGKLMPTQRARAIGFDPALRSGEDIPFYISFFLEHDDLSIKVCPIDAHAVYYRSVRPGTLSRPEMSYQFNVTERLEVVERIERLHPTRHWQRRAAKHMVRGQCKFINEYLLEHPDERPTVLADIRDRDLQSIVYRRLNHGLAHKLVLAHTAPPTAHDRAVAVVKEVRDSGDVVDVLCAAPTHGVRQDKALRAIWRPFVESIHRVEGAPVAPVTWAWTNKYWAEAVEFIDRQTHKPPYRVVHSTADSPATSILAAWYKLAHPSAVWVAEFPFEPAATTIPAPDHGPDPALLAALAAGLRSRGLPLPEDGDCWSWAAHLCVALADEVRPKDARSQQRYRRMLELTRPTVRRSAPG
jgi:glycosyltransferase involved in cell wall biosynthesis